MGLGHQTTEQDFWGTSGGQSTNEGGSGIIENTLGSNRVSGLESGGLDQTTRWIDLGELLDEAAASCARAAGKKGLSFVFTDRPAFPDLAEVDPVRLRQVLASLLDNAVKFTGQGTVELGVRYRVPQPGRAQVDFQVRDTGIGINTGQLAGLLEPFSQVDSSTTRKYGGLGLGLLDRKSTRLNSSH